MTELSGFSRSLLETAKFFLLTAEKEDTKVKEQAYLRAALYHSLAYVEGQVNDVAEHFEGSGHFSVHQRALISEKDVQLVSGEYVIKDRLKIHRLTDRIDVIVRSFGKSPQGLLGYAELKEGMRLRNLLAHPKNEKELSYLEVSKVIEASVSVCDSIAKAVFKKGLPYADRGLEPVSDFH